MNPARQLIELMHAPAGASALSPTDWNQLLPLARAANLLGSLAVRIEAAGAVVPTPVSRHLAGMARLSERQHESVRWEAYQLARILQPLGIPVILLKGAAYVMGALPVARGRLFGDIDILVPRAALGRVEVAMMTHGWTSAKQDAYDQRYYRNWMHELPPLLNVRRGTVLDVHHTLLPLTGRLHPDPELLVAAASPLTDLPPLRIPAPADLVIHSITHLFHEGEFHNGLRDLFDIDGLLRHFADNTPDFWDLLLTRARALQLARPLFYGLHFAKRLIGTPVPATVLREAQQTGAPHAIALRCLELLFDRGLQPLHPACDSALTPSARGLLYLRAHWLRMPPHLLAVHLLRKAWKNAFPATAPLREPPMEN